MPRLPLRLVLRRIGSGLLLLFIGTIVVVGVLSLTGGRVSQVFRDCAWWAPAFAWVDENGNGVYDEGDTPLQGVRFTVNDLHNNFHNVGDTSVSDWMGKAPLHVYLPGCPTARFEVTSSLPSGYDRLTPDTVPVVGEEEYGSSDTVAFGFRRQAGFLTPTPYRIGMACTVTPQKAEDIAVSPDGTLWAGLWNGAARYQPQTDTWEEFKNDTAQFALFEHIQTGPNGVVWIGAFNEGAARLQNGVWTSYLGEFNPIGLVLAQRRMDLSGLSPTMACWASIRRRIIGRTTLLMTTFGSITRGPLAMAMCGVLRSTHLLPNLSPSPSQVAGTCVLFTASHQRRLTHYSQEMTN